MFDLNAIINRIKSGESQTYREIIREYAPDVRFFLASNLFAKDMVEDLAQETFISAYENISKFDLDHNFRQWLIGIAANKLKMYYRSLKTQKSAYEKVLDIIRKKQQEENQEEELISKEKLRLHKCLEAIPIRTRDILKGHYFQNIQIKQMAELQKTTEDAISSLLYRTKRKLADCLGRA
jgi:RNA polymerase sigma-70 factor (ECF subfamily)